MPHTFNRPTTSNVAFCTNANKAIKVSLKDNTENATLQDLGMHIDNACIVSSLLRATQNIQIDEKQVPFLTIQRIRDMENKLKESNYSPKKGLDAIFSYVDPDELLATADMVPLRTQYNNSEQRDDEFDAKQTLLCILPGLEGHHGRFRLMCERLKLPAIVLQPVFCLGGGPEEYLSELEQQLRVATASESSSSEQALQDAVVRHMCALMGGGGSAQLEAALRDASSWREKVEASVRALRGRVAHSSQYARALIEAAYARVTQARQHARAQAQREPRALQSRVVLLRSPPPAAAAAAAAAPAAAPHPLQRYSRQTLRVHDLRAPLTRCTDDLRVAAFINQNLDQQILEKIVCSPDNCQIVLCDDVGLTLKLADRLVKRGARTLHLHSTASDSRFSLALKYFAVINSDTSVGEQIPMPHTFNRPTTSNVAFRTNANKAIKVSLKDNTENATLQDLGMHIDNACIVSSLLRATHNIQIDEKQVPFLTIQRIRDMENKLKESNYSPKKGLDAIFSYVDPDELLATADMVPLRTQYNNSEQIYLTKIASKRFYLLGYEMGVPMALEMASILEDNVFCLGGGPEELELQLRVATASESSSSEQALQDAVVRHMCALMGGGGSAQLEAALRDASSWREKVEASVRALRGRVAHSSQYARALIEAAYARVTQARQHARAQAQREPRALQSRVVLLRSPPPAAAAAAAAAPAAAPHPLQRYSRQTLRVHDLRAPLTRCTDDLRVAAFINQNLDQQILEKFMQMERNIELLLNEH
ncbi:hypothetical protein MSG28_005890 [Choristoneura fumiferana]|uniref:Uncharacterized protein n=1 Tax=Choristoneura fumiferana TaxID=7141 RepID=A0ACC0L0R9_CHOFU|nr:hypothetical protein MSG28_005890 [Choristoneura fumiferana]